MKRINNQSDVVILTDDEQPGYLPVKISNYNIDSEQVEFYGVDKRGRYASGLGVSASKVEKNEKGAVAFFDIKNLVQTNQFTDNIVEGVIAVEGSEIGRDEIRNEPSIYLG